ncbi:glycosyltransferase, partial [Candidatus Roizmanbacteria bacterium]|nr:glycosyltransferase [Candidatus Roizmanbacteria bacterium]
MKITFVSTVFNEEKNIDLLIDSITYQAKFPDEVIIVDGGSTDATASVISNLILSEVEGQISNKKLILPTVIPAKAGIQGSTRFPIKSGMTKMRNMS